MNACPKLTLGRVPGVPVLFPRLVLNTPDVLPIDSAGLAARDRALMGREYMPDLGVLVKLPPDEPFDRPEENKGACIGDWGTGMDEVDRDGERATPGEALRRDGDEPRGRLYGSKRSSWPAGVSHDQ